MHRKALVKELKYQLKRQKFMKKRQKNMQKWGSINVVDEFKYRRQMNLLRKIANTE